MTDARPQRPPEGRYPAQRSARSRRRWLIVLSTLVVVAGVGIAYLSYQKFSDPPVRGTDLGFEVVDASTMRVRFTVERSDPTAPVTCVVRARSADGAETGRREVLVPGGPSHSVEVTAIVRTSAPPAVGNVYGCNDHVPEYLQPDPAVVVR